jgi:hypothetical protein
MVYLTVRAATADATLLVAAVLPVAQVAVLVVQGLQTLAVAAVGVVMAALHLPALLVLLEDMLRLGLLAHRLPILTQLEQAVLAHQTHMLVEQVAPV